MRGMILTVSSVSLLLLLSGCGSQTGDSHQTASSVVNKTANSSISPNITVKHHPTPNANWVLTNALVKQAKWDTEYNQNLSINKGVYGETSTYSDWQLPPKWKPYLYKHEQYMTPKTGPAHLNRKSLFITLQGTVYLKEGVAGRYWPPSAAMDIPPDATIVAEFVPLKPAVKAGIIPVYHGPQVPGIGYIQPKVLKVLGMTRTEFNKDIGNPK